MSFSNERIGKIYNISNEIDFNDLIYCFKGPNTAPINFIDFRGPMHIYDEIKNGNISIEKIEEDQKQFKSKLNEITTGNSKHKSKNQLDAIKNIKSFYNSREKLIKLKYQLHHGMIILNCQMDHILHQIFKTILSIFYKSMEKILMILQ